MSLHFLLIANRSIILTTIAILKRLRTTAFTIRASVGLDCRCCCQAQKSIPCTSFKVTQTRADSILAVIAWMRNAWSQTRAYGKWAVNRLICSSYSRWDRSCVPALESCLNMQHEKSTVPSSLLGWPHLHRINLLTGCTAVVGILLEWTPLMYHSCRDVVRARWRGVRLPVAISTAAPNIWINLSICHVFQC